MSIGKLLASLLFSILVVASFGPLLGTVATASFDGPTAVLNVSTADAGVLTYDAQHSTTITASDPSDPTQLSYVSSGVGTIAVEFTYYSKNHFTTLLPCQQAHVELWAMTNGKMTLVTTSNTDDNGEVWFTNMSSGTYRAAIYATDDLYVEVKNFTATDQPIYCWWTEWDNITGNASWTLDISDTERGAWSAYDAIRSGALWFLEQVGWSRDIVTINWPTEEWPHSHGDNIDIPASTGSYDAIWDEGGLIHEYGHCVYYTSQGDSFPSVEGPDPHYIDSVSNEEFAFVEGWAEFFESAAKRYSFRADGSSLEATVYADSPFGHGDYGDWDGAIVEGAVANILWDIADGNSTADMPSWDTTGVGDNVDEELPMLWAIMLQNDVTTIDDVWSYWPSDGPDLTFIFNHARIFKESERPTNPTTFTSSHVVGASSNDSSIDVTWSGATDEGSGIAGYAIVWDHSPNTVPGATITNIDPSVSTGLTEGTWYLHIRSIDSSGNAANGSFTVGPFIILETAIDRTTNATTDLVDLAFEMLIIAAFVLVAVLLVYLVSKVVRKPREEDIKPMQQPSWQMYHGQYPPVVPRSPASGQFAPPPPIPLYMREPSTEVQQQAPPTARYCRNCGQPEAGGSYCPHCGYKLR